MLSGRQWIIGLTLTLAVIVLLAAGLAAMFTSTPWLLSPILYLFPHASVREMTFGIFAVVLILNIVTAVSAWRLRSVTHGQLHH